MAALTPSSAAPKRLCSPALVRCRKNFTTNSLAQHWALSSTQP